MSMGIAVALRSQFSSTKRYAIRVEEVTPKTWLPELGRKGALHSMCLPDWFSWAVPKQTWVNESEYLLTHQVSYAQTLKYVYLDIWGKDSAWNVLTPCIKI